MEYLKKKKMRAVMQELIPDVKIPALNKCEYRFYRGSEWLRFWEENTEEYVQYELYRFKNSYRIERYLVDEDTGAKKSTMLRRYLKKDTAFLLQYERR